MSPHIPGTMRPKRIERRRNA